MSAMRARLLAALLAILPVAHGVAQDAPKPLPLFVEQPGENENLGEPHIHFWKVPLPNKQTRLIIWGGVDPGDAARFRDAIDQTPKPIAEILILYSPGGVLEEGLQIGRIIHANKLAIRIPSQGECVSACNFIFLGGLIRTIDVGGKFVVHLFHLGSAPRAIMLDIDAAAAAARPDPDPDPSQGTAPAPSAASLAPPADTVGKIPPPTESRYLHGLGCEMDHVYTPDYDAMVQKQEISLETGKNEKDIKLSEMHVQSQVGLAKLRAATMDYVCLEQSTAVSAAEIALFLVEMRMSLRFITTFTNIANALPVPMTRDELRSLNITNAD
jgi:hypothetical protein